MQQAVQKVESFGCDKDFRPLIARYFREEVAGKALLTVKAKQQDLKKWLLFYEVTNGHLDASQWMVRDTKLFLLKLEQQGYKAASVNRMLATVRAFGHWLQHIGALTANPCRGIRELQIDPGPPKGIDDLTYHRLQKAAALLIAKHRSVRSEDFRNHTLMEFLNASALRISEALSIKLPMVRGKYIRDVRCKGGKVRTITINQACADLLEDYIREHRTEGSDYLFTNYMGGRLSASGFTKALHKIADVASAGLREAPVVTSHRFRHRHARKCRERVDIQFLAKRLGHSSLKYAGRYSDYEQEKEEKLLEEIS